MGIDNQIFEIKDLSFSYKERKILHNLNFSLEGGKHTIILGRNGSGKSTLLRILTGIIPLQSGTIFFERKEISSFSNREKAHFLAFLSQQHKALFPFKVHEVILTGRTAYAGFSPSSKDYSIANDCMEIVGITNLKNRLYTELSGGEQQLVMIARVLTQQPKILLLDEPISHLDYSNQIRILKLIKQLTKTGLTVFTALHDPNLAIQFADEIIFLHNAETTKCKNEKIWNLPLLHEIYFYELTAIENGNSAFLIPKEDAK